MFPVCVNEERHAQGEIGPILEEVSYTELGEWKDGEGVFDRMAALGFGPESRFMARMDTGLAAVTERILFVDGVGERQRRVFDSSVSWIKICGNDEIQWLQRGDDRGVAVALHFPPGSTGGIDRIKGLEFSDGRESGLPPPLPHRER